MNMGSSGISRLCNNGNKLWPSIVFLISNPIISNKVGKISKSKIEEIAKIKMPDLNTDELSSAVKMIEGTARSMGVVVEG